MVTELVTQKWDRGEILANFKRGRDNMGTSGWLNDEADVTMQVRFYLLTILVFMIWLQRKRVGT